MDNCVLLISDNLQKSAFVAEEFGRWFHVESVRLNDYSENQDRKALFLIFDVDLADRKIINRLKSIIQSESEAQERIFIVKSKLHDSAIQANSLGASELLTRPINKHAINKIILRYSDKTKNNDPAENAEDIGPAVQALSSLQDGFYESILSNKPLPKEQVESCSGQIISGLEDNPIEVWMETVKTYHSYTYRHCMTVSGVVTAFALHLGMRHADTQRLTVGALVHDIGKVRIPLDILDKPGALTPEERSQINLHPGYSAEILREDGQFNEEVIDIALHHHELLDGSGYPDGLKGDEITDPVRIMTIVDIYSALIDKRSYKDAMSGEGAYEILLSMDGKLDMSILKAFEPTALGVQSQGQNLPECRVAV
jgi:putative nucleotidyltransferase with HDIG domain